MNQDTVTNWSANQVDRHNKQQIEKIQDIIDTKGHYGRIKGKDGVFQTPKTSNKINSKPVDKIYRMKKYD